VQQPGGRGTAGGGGVAGAIAWGQKPNPRSRGGGGGGGAGDPGGKEKDGGLSPTRGASPPKTPPRPSPREGFLFSLGEGGR